MSSWEKNRLFDIWNVTNYKIWFVALTSVNQSVASKRRFWHFGEDGIVLTGHSWDGLFKHGEAVVTSCVAQAVAVIGERSVAKIFLHHDGLKFTENWDNWPHPYLSILVSGKFFLATSSGLLLLSSTVDGSCPSLATVTVNSIAQGTGDSKC